mgnify:CR=1 FL=1
MNTEKANIQSQKKETNALPVTNELQDTPESKVGQYSQEVMDYQGRANGFFTYTKAWLNLAWIAVIGVLIGFAIIKNDPSIIAPEAPYVPIETPAIPELPVTV